MGDQLGNPIGPVEQRIFGVGVEVGEGQVVVAYFPLCSSSRHTASSGTPRACSSTTR
jgi:hypothetical protein